MDAEVRARLVEVADRAVENYDSGAEPYRSVGEAVIDALLIETVIVSSDLDDPVILDDKYELLPFATPVFRLGVLSLPRRARSRCGTCGSTDRAVRNKADLGARAIGESWWECVDAWHGGETP